MIANNHTETENSSSKLLFTNNATTSILDQLFSIEIVTTSGSFQQYTAANLIPDQGPSIPHISEHENISMKQLAKRKRRQQQRQRRQQKREEQRRQQEPQPQREPKETQRQQPQNKQQRRGQQKEQQRRRQRQKQQVQRPTELQIQQRPQPEPRRTRLLSKTCSEMDREREYWCSQGFEDYMEDSNTPLLEAYDSEKLEPKQRWEQEQLNDFEGFVLLEQLALINDQLGENLPIETIQP